MATTATTTKSTATTTTNQQQQPQQNQPQQQPQHQHQIQDPAGPQQQLVHLNWSNFKPEFSGKPDEDAEAHLFQSNDWRNAHHFIEGVKVQRFCLTLLGEARLWYNSLEPINLDLPELKICLGKDIQHR